MSDKDQYTFRAKDRKSWRAWLAKNHLSQKEIWLVFPKKHTGKESVSYEESVEEALCYGWIDSIVKRIDEDAYCRKFTPRTDSENWSEINKRRLEKCIKEGLMTEAGLAKINYSNAKPRPRPVMPKALSSPALVAALQKNPQAQKNFDSLSPYHQRRYVGWISMAKRAETVERRLQEAIQLLTENQKLGPK
jgi:uncharacterized protein YdeI (YjbR/CyaY-like superfamily)